MHFLIDVMTGFETNYPLQYFGFVSTKIEENDKTVTLDVSVRGLDACNIPESGDNIHQCASINGGNNCLVTNLTVKLFQKIIFIYKFFQDIHLKIVTTFLNLHYRNLVAVFYWTVQSLLAYLLSNRLIVQMNFPLSQLQSL